MKDFERLIEVFKNKKENALSVHISKNLSNEDILRILLNCILMTYRNIGVWKDTDYQRWLKNNGSNPKQKIKKA